MNHSKNGTKNFFVLKDNISQRSYFSCPQGQISLKKALAFASAFFWWKRVDSNHRSRRQQIYSLPPLATRELFRIQFVEVGKKNWSWWTDSNPRPADYKSAALPAELHQHLNARIIYHKSSAESRVKSKKIEIFVQFPLLSSSVMTAAEFFAARAVNFE